MVNGDLVVQEPLRAITPNFSYFSSYSLDLLFFFLFRLFLGTRKALLSAVEGAVEKAVIPRIADRVEDSRHHRAMNKDYSTSCLASVRLPSPHQLLPRPSALLHVLARGMLTFN